MRRMLSATTRTLQAVSKFWAISTTKTTRTGWSSWGTWSTEDLILVSSGALAGARQREEHVFLRGNHEEFVLSLAEGSSHRTTLAEWSGRACMRSYGISDDYIESVGVNYFIGWGIIIGSSSQRWHWAIRSRWKLHPDVFPTEHLRLMRSMPDKHESGDYLFVHEH
jgi:hypothetical protein